MAEIDEHSGNTSASNGRFVLAFGEIGRRRIAEVGGKGANLGELSRIAGIEVPAGFCVTTHAFREAVLRAPSLEGRLDQLALLDPDDRTGIAASSAEVRALVEGLPVPDEIAAATARALAREGEGVAHAVRSSATAEDQPTSSFAGQHDTYLDVVGLASVLEHVSRCWGSLFTERAVTYRLRRGLDQRSTSVAAAAAALARTLDSTDGTDGTEVLPTVERVLGRPPARSPPGPRPTATPSPGVSRERPDRAPHRACRTPPAPRTTPKR